MTVDELIRQLQQYDNDLMVVIAGEGLGVNEFCIIEQVQIIPNHLKSENAWYYGTYAIAGVYEKAPKETMKAIHLTQRKQ